MKLWSFHFITLELVEGSSGMVGRFVGYQKILTPYITLLYKVPGISSHFSIQRNGKKNYEIVGQKDKFEFFSFFIYQTPKKIILNLIVVIDVIFYEFVEKFMENLHL